MNKSLMRLRLKRAIMLCDVVIEDLNCADLDITIHKKLTELHELILMKHKELMEEERAKSCTHDWVSIHGSKFGNAEVCMLCNLTRKIDNGIQL